MLTAYQRLGVDTMVLGVADRLVDLPDGTQAVLHLSTTLKKRDEPFDAAFWGRLASLFEHPPTLPGTATAFHPLAIQTIARSFDESARDAAHSYRVMLWWQHHRFRHNDWRTQEPDFHQREADWIDREVAGVQARHEGTFDGLATFLPECVAETGRPRGFLARRAAEMRGA